jgi:flagellar hook-basal body complex protein FliE
MSKVSSMIGLADAWMRGADAAATSASHGVGIERPLVAPGGFESALTGELAKVFGSAKEVTQAVAAYNAGGEEASVERAAFLMAKSEAALRLAVQVRNKAVNAYQDVMNLQI